MPQDLFRTVFEIPQPPFSIAFSNRLLFLGSCFADNMAEQLSKRGFSVAVNPTGTTYNPLSVAQTLRLLLDHTTIDPSDLFHYNGIYHDFRFHGRFSFPSAEEAAQAMNASLRSIHLESMDTLILTLGTSFVYFHNDTIVNNCHKLPASQFTRRRLSVTECVTPLANALRDLHHLNPSLRVILTVSPIRHLSDGAHDNTLSKATLQLTCEQILNNPTILPASQICYFPSYELLLDDLRDYRFYANDMAHPSDAAVEYIYKRFDNTFFSDDTHAQAILNLKQWKTTQHRPLH